MQHCTCPSTGCTKRYCLCLKRGQLCTSDCTCRNCQNNDDHVHDILANVQVPRIGNIVDAMCHREEIKSAWNLLPGTWQGVPVFWNQRPAHIVHSHHRCLLTVRGSFSSPPTLRLYHHAPVRLQRDTSCDDPLEPDIQHWLVPLILLNYMQYSQHTMMSYVLCDEQGLEETGWLILARVMHASLHTAICNVKRVMPELWHTWRKTRIYVPRAHKTKSTPEEATRLPPPPPGGLW
jgi:Tesmin/TSO1-like CXC domain, cysteine-rich domain